MSTPKPDKLWPVAAFVLTQIFAAAGVYGAIRADLRESSVRITIAEKRIERLEDRKP